ARRAGRGGRAPRERARRRGLRLDRRLSAAAGQYPPPPEARSQVSAADRQTPPRRSHSCRALATGGAYSPHPASPTTNTRTPRTARVGEFICASLSGNSRRGVVAAARTSKWLAQQSVQRYGHCNVTPAEVATTLSRLVSWAENAVKPASGDVTLDLAVSSPGSATTSAVSTVTSELTFDEAILSATTGLSLP